MSDDRPVTAASSAATAENTEQPTAEPPTITYRCRPDGFVCSQCGTKTETQWVDDGAFVCPDCKSWA